VIYLHDCEDMQTPAMTATYLLEAATMAFEHAVRNDTLKVQFDVN